jgi:hypothetical protein
MRVQRMIAIGMPLQAKGEDNTMKGELLVTGING